MSTVSQSQKTRPTINGLFFHVVWDNFSEFMMESCLLNCIKYNLLVWRIILIDLSHILYLVNGLYHRERSAKGWRPAVYSSLSALTITFGDGRRISLSKWSETTRMAWKKTRKQKSHCQPLLLKVLFFFNALRSTLYRLHTYLVPKEARSREITLNVSAFMITDTVLYIHYVKN